MNERTRFHAIATAGHDDPWCVVDLMYQTTVGVCDTKHSAEHIAELLNAEALSRDDISRAEGDSPNRPVGPEAS